jgi:hypothetical protein
MFVEFEETKGHEIGTPGGSVWINPENVCTVSVRQEAIIDNEKINKDDRLYGPMSYIQPPVTEIRTSNDMVVYVLCDLKRTLNKLSKGN